MYYVPKNVKSRFEIVPGIGIPELFVIVIAAGLGIGISFLLYLVTSSVFSFIFAVFIAAIGVFIAKPHPVTGKNAISMLKDVQAYKMKQKRYYYRYGSGRK
ncbi:PrgI family mobile element protein [Paenibacillus taichungensis]|uniref:PrgI family mobile element protein n=1 Tax=Paenibacillus taichungensis TaxID=484184 RepID=UPI0035E0BAC5